MSTNIKTTIAWGSAALTSAYIAHRAWNAYFPSDLANKSLRVLSLGLTVFAAYAAKFSLVHTRNLFKFSPKVQNAHEIFIPLLLIAAIQCRTAPETLIANALEDLRIAKEECERTDSALKKADQEIEGLQNDPAALKIAQKRREIHDKQVIGARYRWDYCKRCYQKLKEVFPTKFPLDQEI